MRRKGVDRMAQHRRAAERQILLWQIAAKPCATAGGTEAIISSFIRLTASPRKKTRTSCPASAKAFAWRKAKAAFVGSSDPHALLIKIFMLAFPLDRVLGAYMTVVPSWPMAQ